MKMRKLYSNILLAAILSAGLILTSCHSDDCSDLQYPIEDAPAIPPVIMSADTLVFIITEGNDVDTIVLQKTLTDTYHTLERGIFCEGLYVQNKRIKWETNSGEAFNYTLYSTLPAKYSSEFNYSNPDNVTEISFKNFKSIFAHDKIIAANDTTVTKIESFSNSGKYYGFDEGILYFDKWGIKEMNIPSKNFKMIRAR